MNIIFMALPKRSSSSSIASKSSSGFDLPPKGFPSLAFVGLKAAGNPFIAVDVIGIKCDAGPAVAALPSGLKSALHLYLQCQAFEAVSIYKIAISIGFIIRPICITSQVVFLSWQGFSYLTWQHLPF